MTDQELEAALQAFNRRRPFQPFLLEFVSGEQIQVHHREAIAFFTKFWYYLGPHKVQALFPSSSVCRLLDVPAVE